MLSVHVHLYDASTFRAFVRNMPDHHNKTVNTTTSYRDQAELSAADMVWAIGLHLLVVLAIIQVGFWRIHPSPKQPEAIEVHLISSAQLKTVHRHHVKRSKPVVHHRRKPKPIVHKQKKRTARPTIHKAKPTHRKKQKHIVKDDFDPFKPITSSSDKKVSTKHRSNQKVISSLKSQLSSKEINRYIAMIQSAVQQHWKVSAVSANTRDPLVKMTLNPDGSVRRIQIIESSGNHAFDESLIRAIQAASPFTLPHKQFEVFRNNRIRFHALR